MQSSMLSTHKTRMQILSPGANNSTLREKFSAHAIFSYHGKPRLWQHICLKVYVIPGELCVWVNGNTRMGQPGSSSANTTPLGSFTSHTIRLSSRSRGKPCLVSSCPMSMEPGMMQLSMLSTHKTRMQILSPGANNSTSRDKFSAQAIFSYHAT